MILTIYFTESYGNSKFRCQIRGELPNLLWTGTTNRWRGAGGDEPEAL